MTREEKIEILEMAQRKSIYDGRDRQAEALTSAIKALKQEPCDDAISRQAVNTLIDELARAISDERCCISRGRSTATIMQDILDLPPVKQEPRWIPVSERLPNIADTYLVTRYFPNNVMNPTYLVDTSFFDGTDTWHNDNRINHERAYIDNVIAWQENPEPYMPQESEDKE